MEGENFFCESFFSALGLIGSGDPELLTIVKVSLLTSFSSTVVASILGIPAGFWLAFKNFPGRSYVITVLNTLLGLPTVVIGLFVYVFVSRRGVLGALDLLYTPGAMIVGQTILILPVVIVFTLTAVGKIDRRYHLAALTLGADPIQTAWAVFGEARFGVIAAVILAFGRVISEVGVSMMLGGNIQGVTRTIPTAMALEYDKGEFILSVALGIVLMTISLGVNVFFHQLQGRIES